jgi:hypothetical protein
LDANVDDELMRKCLVDVVILLFDWLVRAIDDVCSAVVVDFSARIVLDIDGSNRFVTIMNGNVTRLRVSFVIGTGVEIISFNL